MARNGRLEKARDLFRDSLVVKQVPEAWQNLAKVHEKLAQSSSAEFAQENLKLAQLANDEFALASQQPSNSIQRVQWVEPESYNQENTISFSENRVAELPGLEAPQKKSLIKKLFR